MSKLHKLNSASTYPPLDLPAPKPEQLKRGTKVQTRYFYGNSVPGNKSKVIRTYQSSNGNWYVRVNCGKNLGNQSIIKTIYMNALALDD